MKEQKRDVLDIFSKVMFFSSWNSPNQSDENRKAREENIDFIIKELERLVGFDRLENKLGMSLKVFIKCLTLLSENKFTYVYWADKKKTWICTALTPVAFALDMEKKMFIELRRPEGYEQKLKFKEYGIKWALTEGELK